MRSIVEVSFFVMILEAAKRYGGDPMRVKGRNESVTTRPARLDKLRASAWSGAHSLSNVSKCFISSASADRFCDFERNVS